MTPAEFEGRARWFADEYDLDQKRVACLLSRLYHVGTFSLPPQEELLRATLAFGPERAVAFLEEADLFLLGLRVRSYDFLSSPLTPLVTLGELRTLTRRCLEFLRDQTPGLLAVGLPAKPFKASAWHDWHLGRLLFVKRPVVIEGDDWVTALKAAAIPSDAVPTRRGDRLEYWTLNRPRPPFRLELVTPEHLGLTESLLSRVPQEPFDLSLDSCSGLLDEDQTSVTYCDYGDAGNMKRFTAQDIAWIEGIREKLLHVRVRCLEVLLKALERSNATHIWSECTAILTSSLSEQQVDGLFGIEERYGGRPCEWPPLWMLPCKPFSDNCAGLTELLTVIGHVDRELTIGRHARLCDAFGEEKEKLGAGSYYMAAAEGDLSGLDEMLYAQIWLSLQEEPYWDKQQALVDDLWRRFPREVQTSIHVPQDQAERASRFLQQAGEVAAGYTVTGLPLPDLRAVAEPQNERSAENVFRKRGDKWQVIYGGSEAFVDDLKGMHYIRELLQRPDVDVPAMTLAAGPRQHPDELHSAMSEARLAAEWLGYANIDAAMSQVSESGAERFDEAIEELEAELQSARAVGEPERVAELKERVQELRALRTALFDHSGRERQPRKQTENVRVAVKKAIDRAIGRLPQSLQKHLWTAIKTGHVCCYNPIDDEKIEWTLN